MVYYFLFSCVVCWWCFENINFIIFVDWNEYLYDILKRFSKNCLEFGKSNNVCIWWIFFLV